MEGPFKSQVEDSCIFLSFIFCLCLRHGAITPATTEPEAVGTRHSEIRGLVTALHGFVGEVTSVSLRACPFVKRDAQESIEDSPDRP